MKRSGTLILCVALLLTLAPTAFAKEIIVDEFIEIPALQQEIVTVRPSGDHVWIPGSWERETGKWSWSAGHWEKPPHKWAHWSPGHWAWQDSKWHWRAGHWAAGQRNWIVEEVIDVPAAIQETRPPMPSEHNHWVSGHWDWDAGWYWVAGYYTTKPNPKAVWVPGRWEPFGLDGGYWWMGGHWRVS